MQAARRHAGVVGQMLRGGGVQEARRRSGGMLARWHAWRPCRGERRGERASLSHLSRSAAYTTLWAEYAPSTSLQNEWPQFTVAVPLGRVCPLTLQGHWLVYCVGRCGAANKKCGWTGGEGAADQNVNPAGIGCPGKRPQTPASKQPLDNETAGRAARSDRSLSMATPCTCCLCLWEQMTDMHIVHFMRAIGQ